MGRELQGPACLSVLTLLEFQVHITIIPYYVRSVGPTQVLTLRRQVPLLTATPTGACLPHQEGTASSPC